MAAQGSASRASPRSFMEEVIASVPGGDSNLELWVQCGTCGGSCPSGPDMEHTPRQLFAMIEAGMKDEVLRSNAPWYCVSCYYCMVRCPQEIHITDIMYALKRMAIKEGLYHESSAVDAPDFSETFIDFVENYGRSFELGLATRYHLKHHPHGYYPGCSLERNASAYHESAMVVADQFDVGFVEVPDWNCCGATKYIAIDLIPAYALIGRNLALAQQLELTENGSPGPNQLIAPCSACFLNLSKADKYLGNAPMTRHWPRRPTRPWQQKDES